MKHLALGLLGIVVLIGLAVPGASTIWIGDHIGLGVTWIDQDPEYPVNITNITENSTRICIKVVDKHKNKDIPYKVYRDKEKTKLKENKTKKYNDDDWHCEWHYFNDSIINKTFVYGFASSEWTFDNNSDSYACVSVNSCSNGFDGNTGTSTSDSGFINFNYSKDKGLGEDYTLTEAIVEHWFTSWYNATVPSTCVTYDPDTLILRYEVRDVGDATDYDWAQCYNGSWINFSVASPGVSRGKLFEEQILLGYDFATGINVTIYNEITEELFNMSHVNETRLEIICGENSTIVNITDNSGVYNTTCLISDTKLRLSMTLNGETYFRTLLPDTNSSTFYMADLITDIVVKTDFLLADFTGDYVDGYGKISKRLQNGTEVIISDYFDASNTLIAFLAQNGEYIISVNTETSSFSFGDYLADAARSKVLQINTMEFLPDTTTILGSVYTQVTKSTDKIIFMYNDSLNQTTNVSFYVYNSTNTSQVLHFDDSTTSSSYFEYAVPDINQSYIVVYVYEHDEHGTQSGRVVISWQRSIVIEQLESKPYYYSLFAIVLCVILMFAFGPRHVDVGAIFTALAGAYFWYIGWFEGYTGAGVVVGASAIAILNYLGRRT